MDLAAVMDEVADLLRTIDGLRVFEYPPGSVTPPATGGVAIVTYPTELEFDATYGRGTDRMTLPVVVVVGKALDRTARSQLAAYCDGSGASSVKAALEPGDEYTAFETLRVQSVEFDVVSIGGNDYLAAEFSLDIAGRGTGTE